MKKLFAIVFALLFTLSIVSAMADGVTFTSKYFTMELPEGWETADPEQEADDKDAPECLGVFGQSEGEGLVCEAYIEYDEDSKTLSLWNSDAEELKDYAEAVMEGFEEDNPVYLDTIKANGIPFVLIRATDEDGEYLHANTVSNGYYIHFMVYAADAEGEFIPLADKYIEEFKTILNTFKPAA